MEGGAALAATCFAAAHVRAQDATEETRYETFDVVVVGSGFAGLAVAFSVHFGVGCRSGDAICCAGTTGMTAGREAALL